MKRFALVILFILVACSGESSSGKPADSLPGGEGGSPSDSDQSLPPVKLALKGAINTLLRSHGDSVGITSKWIRFFGEIINNGETSVCSVNIHITSTVPLRSPGANNLTDTQGGSVYGVNLSGDQHSAAVCLRPGEFGAFQVDSHHTKGTIEEPVPSLALPSSISFNFVGVNDNIVEPKIHPSDVVLSGPLTVGENLAGNVTIDGTLENINDLLIASSPQISIVALRNEMVIGIHPGFIQNECRRMPWIDGVDLVDHCLRPGELFNFHWILPGVKSDEMTDFYYKIAYGTWEEK